jgi:hypothetical protein
MAHTVVEIFMVFKSPNGKQIRVNPHGIAARMTGRNDQTYRGMGGARGDWARTMVGNVNPATSRRGVKSVGTTSFANAAGAGGGASEAEAANTRLSRADLSVCAHPSQRHEHDQRRLARLSPPA